jgi:hypothetical protein
MIWALEYDKSCVIGFDGNISILIARSLDETQEETLKNIADKMILEVN